jgi:hypothetical protein
MTKTGILYASTNKQTPGGVKLGKTIDTAQARANQTITGSPYPQVPVHYAEFQVEEVIGDNGRAYCPELHRLESAMHNHPKIAPTSYLKLDQTANGGREWFTADIEVVKEVMLELQMDHAPTRKWLEQKAINDKILAEKLEQQAEKELALAAIRAEQLRIAVEKKAEQEQIARIAAEKFAEQKRIEKQKEDATVWESWIATIAGFSIIAAVLFAMIGYEFLGTLAITLFFVFGSFWILGRIIAGSTKIFCNFKKIPTPLWADIEF